MHQAAAIVRSDNDSKMRTVKNVSDTIMKLRVIKSNKPMKAKSTSVIAANAAFSLKRSYNITIHRADGFSPLKKHLPFYHIKKEGKVIGFSCHYLLAIDKAYSYLKQLPSEAIRSLINTAYLDMQHRKARGVLYGDL